LTDVGAGIEAGAPALEPDLARPLPRALRAFGFRDFRIFWAGALLSTIGSNMQLAALAWVVAVATRSALQVTLIAFATIFPMLLLGPLGGSLADRLPRRRLLLSTQSLLMVQAFVLWAVWELGYGHYWALFGISLAGGIVIALNTPAWQSIVPELVPRSHLQNAITLNSTQFNVSRALGPMIGGLLIGTVGAGICFLINALSYLAVIGALLLIRRGDDVAEPEDGTTSLGVFDGFTESVRYLRDEPGIKVALTVTAVFALLSAPVVQLIPVLSVEVLHIDAEAYGLLLGSFGLGAVGIAIVIGTIDQHVLPSRLLGGGLLLTAIAVAGLGVSPGIVVGVLFMIAFGAAYVSVVAINHSAIQSLSGDHIRGRVTSLWLMIYGTAFPLGNLLMGVTADAFGVRAVLVACGALVAVALLVLTLRQALPRIDTPALEELLAESATAPERP
jgi:MFS family permease